MIDDSGRDENDDSFFGCITGCLFLPFRILEGIIGFLFGWS